VSRLVLVRVATRPFGSLDAFSSPAWAAAERRLASREAELREERAALETALFEVAGPPDGSGARAASERHAVLSLLRSVHNGRALRQRDRDRAGERLVPALRAALERHAATAREAASLEREADRLVEASLDAARRGIVASLDDALVREGIEAASTSLLAKLRHLTPTRAASHGDRHVGAKALAYLVRFATKTSPNAVFCAAALGSIAGESCRIEGRPEIERRDILLSVAEARKVAATLAADPAVEAAIAPRINPTLRAEPEGFTFWRVASARREDDRESLSRVRDHPVLRAILEEIEAGAPGLAELRRRVAARAGVDEAQLLPFLRRLIDTGILIAEIEIPYAERRPVRHVARRAREAGCAAAWIDQALAVEEAVDALPDLDPDARGAAMERIARDLERLPRARPLVRDELFRTDAAAGLTVTLPESVLKDLRDAVGDYARLFAAMYPAPRYRMGWVRRYLEKFPADEDVVLLDVYRTLTEQGETFRPAAFPEPEEADREARRAMEAAGEALSGPEEEVGLRDVLERAGIATDPEPRWAAGVLFQIAARDVAAISRGAYRIALNGLFQGAGLSLSRFAHLLDTDAVVSELRRAWSVVERPGAIVAELTYNHLGRTANAGLRPAVFRHEIELPGDFASPGAVRLALRDLTVRWDTREDRFVLRSPTDGCEVIPVINSGVNPVGFISFLVAVGEQGFQPVGYLPGFDRPGVTRWPRVTSGRVVVFRERWVFPKESCPAGDGLGAFARAVCRWRETHALPRHVFVHTSREPKPRYVDLESPPLLDLLRRDLATLAGDPAATLQVAEMLPGPGELWMVDGSGRGHATEFLVQMSSVA